MIVDASALLAIVLHEDDGPLFEEVLAAEKDELTMSPVNYVEAYVRASKPGPRDYVSVLDELIQTADIRLAPITVDQAHLARQAYETYGKGRHPAGLNLGDCFAYALAKARRKPLLYKGNDFSQTDIEAAL